MELNTTITRGKFSLTLESRPHPISGNLQMAAIYVREDGNLIRMTLDQDERDALVKALQSIPREVYD